MRNIVYGIEIKANKKFNFGKKTFFILINAIFAIIYLIKYPLKDGWHDAIITQDSLKNKGL
ncbi:hypothetical protein GCM10007111_26580 [Virgibacillus kapii]|uniref:Uncharacterized protein n=1 Tax=Virgibacillus kapii TaxID=1638645 RepID=A0ABQ2DPG1_9BACI|nr:hypothetical protein GCM10007111_26580 [Virgibacillus kapii]